MVAVPADTPVAIPDVPTVATPVLLLLQVPPDGVDPSESVLPTHTGTLPVIAVGKALMVPIAVAVQPVGSV